jgi:HEAT repeat protein
VKRAFILIAIVLVACGDVPGDAVKLRAAEGRLRKDPHDGQSLDFILGKLHDVKKITRNSAAAFLRLLAADPNVRSAIAPKAVPALIEVAGGHDDAESEGIRALGEFRELGAPAVGTLMKRLSDSSLPLVQDATGALGKIGPQSAPAVSALRRQLREDYRPEWNDWDLRVRRSLRIQSAVAIRQIVPNDREALDNLIELLPSADPDARNGAIFALQDLGKLAFPALPALEAYPDDENAQNAARMIKRDAGVQ